jgi:hypothetical protein
MPAIMDKRNNVSLNDHIAEYIKADKEFIDGIRRGVHACCGGKIRRWVEIKRELKLH